MNEQLKFSWGHIIAFLALIIITYISFVGVTYLTNGYFLVAGIATAVIDILLFTFFIGAQMAKATAHKFARKIWIERVLVFCSPIIFLLAIIPYSHFWTVYSHNKEIVNDFTTAISASKQMFDDYKTYATERTDKYKRMLRNVANGQKDMAIECGLTPGKEDIQIGNMVKTLRLQLLSENYYTLKNDALDWIESSSNGANTFNVFLLGNTKEIKKAIHEWNAQLVGFSEKKLNNEEFGGYNKVYSFEETDGNLMTVDDGLNAVTKNFTKMKFPNAIAIACSVLLFFALLFPYFLQDRHTKSRVRLLGTIQHAGNVETEEPMTTDNSSKAVSAPSNEPDDDYSAF